MLEEKLTETLARATPSDDKEREDLTLMRRYAQTLREPFSRSQDEAHFTGSAVVVDPLGRRVCLVLHRKLNRWLQPGGHSGPGDEGSLEATALREAREETGLDVRLHPAAPRPLDVDAHRIPARKNEPEHWHLDVRYLVVAHSPEALAHDPAESLDLRWFSFDEALAQTQESALRRLLSKAQAFAAGE
jgi:8-oxo-dGTP pyrophosphatase MutT (NUDIX family)